MVEIRHRQGFKTHYAKLMSAKVTLGQTVRQGAVVGKLGSSGRSTGPHLHFEVWRQGRAVNPRLVLISRTPRC
jgi:murein DD-endopeptidase MepM/ murein hydrolase activator NlpD